jgi:hypothetical protein
VPSVAGPGGAGEAESDALSGNAARLKVTRMMK